jgi:hypothetical protein
LQTDDSEKGTCSIDAEQAEATLEQIRAALGDQADTAIAAGRAMTLDDAVADALNAISS